MLITDVNGRSVAIDERYIIAAQQCCNSNTVYIYIGFCNEIKKLSVEILQENINTLIEDIEDSFSPIP